MVMKAKNETRPFVKDLSPITCFVKDDTGAGLVGFTAVYTDGSFKNISLAFNPDTEAAMQAEITKLKQNMESGLVAIPAAKPLDNENKHSNQKRRPI
jgi:hypothetical protein